MSYGRLSSIDQIAMMRQHGFLGKSIEMAELQCMGCGTWSQRIKSHSLGRSDAELTKVFGEMGWSVLPTLCPECQVRESRG